MAPPRPIHRLSPPTGKNQPVGFDIDLAHALCQQMQAQCQFTAQRFDTLIPALRFKKFDAVIAGMEVIPMREKQVAFSRPYRQALSGVVIVNKDVAHTFADLKAKKSRRGERHAASALPA
ncbi:ArtI [Klebsiella pneumoniae]|uniref:ArtI n=1 Tax=Klebsiella pneumoniae TaxID=573 RepID=A0A377ZPG7_KLEPN|nr:ArtI [Klebsiella pneumoniae]